jgi:hypothetical protein
MAGRRKKMDASPNEESIVESLSFETAIEKL